MISIVKPCQNVPEDLHWHRRVHTSPLTAITGPLRRTEGMQLHLSWL